MKRALLASLLWSVLLQVSSLADGYPFDPEDQRLRVPSLRLKLSEAQVKEVSALGTLTFSEEQLRLIRAYYPAATGRTDVVAATYNDGRDDYSQEVADCFWVAPDEVAVVLHEECPKDKSPFEEPVNATFPSEAELKANARRHLRLSPTGSIYFQGELITLERALALIDELARFPKPTPETEITRYDRWLSVTMPPPLSAREAESADEAAKSSAKQILEALRAYGISKSIPVGLSW